MAVPKSVELDRPYPISFMLGYDALSSNLKHERPTYFAIELSETSSDRLVLKVVMRELRHYGDSHFEFIAHPLFELEPGSDDVTYLEGDFHDEDGTNSRLTITNGSLIEHGGFVLIDDTQMQQQLSDILERGTEIKYAERAYTQLNFTFRDQPVSYQELRAYTISKLAQEARIWIYIKHNAGTGMFVHSVQALTAIGIETFGDLMDLGRDRLATKVKPHLLYGIDTIMTMVGMPQAAW